MALIIMGVGFLKANISTIVGQLYTRDDPRRDAGFTLYYYGINLGAFWAQVLCAGLGATLWLGAGFGLAGVGMLLVGGVRAQPVAVFHCQALRSLPDEIGAPPDPVKLKKPLFGPINREWIIYICALLAAVGRNLFAGAARADREHGADHRIGSDAGLFHPVHDPKMHMGREPEADPRTDSRHGVGGVLHAVRAWRDRRCPSSLSARRNCRTMAFSRSSSGQTQSFNGAFILIFAPIFAAMWTWFEKNKRDPGDPIKFALGLIQVGRGLSRSGLGHAVRGCELSRCPLIFLVVLYLLHTTGELFLSPVGLSAMTKLAPVPIASTMMATWFLGSSLAQMLQAQISKLTAQETIGGQVLDPKLTLHTYADVFTQVGLWGIGIGVAMAIASPFLNRLAHPKGDIAEPGEATGIGINPASRIRTLSVRAKVSAPHRVWLEVWRRAIRDRRLHVPSCRRRHL